MTPVRRTFCIALLVALGLVAAGAASATAADEGTLSIKRGDGEFTLDMRGVAIGRLLSGILIVEIPASRTCDDLKVWGADDEDPDEFQIIDGEPTIVCGYSGNKIRFRLAGRLGINISDANNLFLSAVGRGELLVQGAGGKDGVMSLNGRADKNLPNKLSSFVLEPDNAAYVASATP